MHYYIEIYIYIILNFKCPIKNWKPFNLYKLIPKKKLQNEILFKNESLKIVLYNFKAVTYNILQFEIGKI